MDASGVEVGGDDVSGAVVLSGVDSLGTGVVGVLGGGTHFVQTVEVLVMVSVEMVLVVCSLTEEPLVIVSVTGQVVKVVKVTSVVTTGTVVAGVDEAGADVVDEASGVVVGGVVDPCVPWVSGTDVELAGTVVVDSGGAEGPGGAETGVVVLAGME